MNGVRVNRDNCAFAHHLGRLVHQTGEPGRHRVAFDIAIGPTAKVAHHIIGGERIAVVPGHALTQVQRVDGRIIIGGPAVQQTADKCAVRIVLDQIFQPAAIDVGDLWPIGKTRVFDRLGFHRHPQGAAHGDMGFGNSGGIQAKQAVSCGRRHTQRGGPG